MKVSIYIAIAVLVLGFSCTGIRQTMQVQGKDPNQGWNYNLWFQRSDLEPLGTVTDSILYTNYFGIINSHKDYRETNRVTYPGLFNGTELFSDYTNRVLYKLYKQKPEADIIIPVKIIRKKQKLFGGSRRALIVVGKAYKLK